MNRALRPTVLALQSNGVATCVARRLEICRTFATVGTEIRYGVDPSDTQYPHLHFC